MQVAKWNNRKERRKKPLQHGSTHDQKSKAKRERFDHSTPSEDYLLVHRYACSCETTHLQTQKK